MARINADRLDLKEIVIKTNRVQKTTKGGRTMSFSVLVAVGDENGHVGIGLGKAAAAPDAIRKGVEDAKKNIIEVPVINGTLPHEAFDKFGASNVVIKPASHGTGVVAGGAVRPILELAGVTDVLSKILGSRNAVNVAKATINCLKSMQVAENICDARGAKLETLVPWYARQKKTAASDAAAVAEAPAENAEEIQEDANA